MDPDAITAVILTRDEERNLPRALTSLPRGMHVLVLDACSRDHTVQFARGAGAEVVQREWTDFVDARRFALTGVRSSWVLMIDADEALDDVLREAIIECGGEADGYTMLRTTYFCGRPMRLWRNEPLLRLFRAGSAVLEAHPAAGGSAAVHERWTSDGPTRQLAGTLLHFSYPDYASYRVKYDWYTSTEAQGVRGSVAGFVRAWTTGALRFWWLLFGKAALLDGTRGAYVAYKSAMYPAVVAWKALRNR
ncbi:MAG: glycosyltransferase family 2 protein [Candidatus Tumulicola sp.]